MIIYYLDDDAQKCAQYLSDDDLNKQIKAIAQVLCNAHYELTDTMFYGNVQAAIDDVPLNHKQTKFDSWVNACRANYLKLLKMGLACINEHCYRFERHSAKYADEKYFNAIHFARDNVPPLRVHIYERDEMGDTVIKTRLLGNQATPFPLILPGKYKHNIIGCSCDDYKNCNIDTIESYRTYYRAKFLKPKKVTCKSCAGHGQNNDPYFQIFFCNDCDGKGYKIIKPKFTRREIPDFLKEVLSD